MALEIVRSRMLPHQGIEFLSEAAYQHPRHDADDYTVACRRHLNPESRKRKCLQEQDSPENTDTGAEAQMAIWEPPPN